MKITHFIILFITIPILLGLPSKSLTLKGANHKPIKIIEKLNYHKSNFKKTQQNQPIVLKWEDLIDINYKIRFFESIDMEASAPIFKENQKKLNGKEVIIKGFVIPFDEDMKYLSLSANPYASCFFCGNASPASVISMYMKETTQLYEVDDFKTFKGILHLNYDDPNEFIYILKNAIEIK